MKTAGTTSDALKTAIPAIVKSFCRGAHAAAASITRTGACLLGVGLLAVLACSNAAAQGARLLATGGVTQVEGAGGGGLVPWALIAGYGTRDQVGGAAFYTRADPTDFRFESAGAAFGFFDRVEVSFARQRLGLGNTVPGQSVRQEVVGIKLKMAGDAIYDQDSILPQIAVGAQYKRNLDFDLVPRALGAKHDSGVDYYLAATKLFLGAVAGRNLLLNATLRATKANQMGLLGFGGDLRDSYSLHPELSAGLFLSERWILGTEYRNKPNNLSVFKEDYFADGFLAYMPNKFMAFTVGHVYFGNIANKGGQRATYLSVQASY